MKKYIYLFCVSLLMTGCGENYSAPVASVNNANDIVGVPDLKGCKIYVIDTSNLNNVNNYLYVVKCTDGNIVTQYSTGGKNPQTISTTLTKSES